jgi:hypothetical protein
MSSVVDLSGVEGVEDFAGDVALETSHDLVFGFAFGQAAGDVLPSARRRVMFCLRPGGG